jgi:hypothetical protein
MRVSLDLLGASSPVRFIKPIGLPPDPAIPPLLPAEFLDDMDLPGLKLHEHKGKRKGTWSVQVTGNWRVTFKLQKGDIFDVNYEDYH